MSKSPLLSALCMITAFIGMLAGSTSAAFPVIAYLPGGNPSNVEFDKLTHVLYSFVTTSSTGTLNGANETSIKNLVTAAHAKNVKVGLAIGGWNNGNTVPFETMAANKAYRTAFVTNLIALCDKHNLDGIDIDWEYPKASSAVNYSTMMKELGIALKLKNRFLSAAVISGGNSVGQYITDEVIDVLDFLNIMAYDGTGINHSPYNLATTSFGYWITQRRCPKEKAILGLGFYGRDVNFGSYTPYRTIVSRDPNAWSKDQSGSLGYNGVPTTERKVDLAAQMGGGVMIWEITQDTHNDQTSLLRAIDRKVKGMTVSLGDPRTKGMIAPMASVISLWAVPGMIRVSGAPQGALTVRLRTVEGRLVYTQAVWADGQGNATLLQNIGGMGQGNFYASVEGDGRSLLNAMLPISH